MTLHGPPIQSSIYVLPAQTIFPVKPVLDLFLEIGRLRFSELHQPILSFWAIRDGNNVLSSLAHFDPHLPVIVITVLTDLDQRLRTSQHGALAFLHKPYN